MGLYKVCEHTGRARDRCDHAWWGSFRGKRVEKSPLTFSKFADVYKQRHVLAKGLALAETIDYRLKPLIERFGDRLLADIKTADIEDFVADLKKPRVVNSIDGRRSARHRSAGRSGCCGTC